MKADRAHQHDHERGCHPPRRGVPTNLSHVSYVDIASTDYNAEAFQSELFPLHSQLLRESWLVSFPPLSYMLKFRGYSCLIRGPIRFFTQIVKNTFPTLHKLADRRVDKYTSILRRVV